jgi:uncharacterized protein YndB with AHSA1/START domain
MNKKMILSIIGIALVAFIGFGLFKANGLKSIEIEKKTTINAPIKEVFDMVQYLKNFPKWSPFLVQDPSQKYEVKGTDGTVGAQYHWDGNGGKDLGYQEIVKIDTFNFIGKKCVIQKPFVANPTFEYFFTENADGIEVKEIFKLESGTMDAFFLWLFGAKAEMEKTNQQGLDLLNKAVTSKS